MLLFYFEKLRMKVSIVIVCWGKSIQQKIKPLKNGVKKMLLELNGNFPKTVEYFLLYWVKNCY